MSFCKTELSWPAQPLRRNSMASAAVPAPASTGPSAVSKGLSGELVSPGTSSVAVSGAVAPCGTQRKPRSFRLSASISTNSGRTRGGKLRAEFVRPVDQMPSRHRRICIHRSAVESTDLLPPRLQDNPARRASAARPRPVAPGYQPEARSARRSAPGPHQARKAGAYCVITSPSTASRSIRTSMPAPCRAARAARATAAAYASCPTRPDSRLPGASTGSIQQTTGDARITKPCQVIQGADPAQFLAQQENLAAAHAVQIVDRELDIALVIVGHGSQLPLHARACAGRC